jgi:hypothetical protein
VWKRRPDLSERLRREIETDADKLTDLQLWRLGAGQLAPVMSVRTDQNREAGDFRLLRHFAMLAHFTVEVHSS